MMGNLTIVKSTAKDLTEGMPTTYSYTFLTIDYIDKQLARSQVISSLVLMKYQSLPEADRC